MHRLLWLCLLAGRVCAGQAQSAPTAATLDSLTRALPLQSDTARVNALKRLFSQATRAKDMPRARQVATEALTLAKKLGYTKGLVDAYHSFNLLYLGTDQYDSSIYYARLFLPLAVGLGDGERIASAHNNMAICYEYMGDFLLARNEYVAAEQTNVRYKQTRFLALNAYNVGLLNIRLGNYPDALAYFDKVDRLGTTLTDSTRRLLYQGMASAGRGRTYLAQGKPQRALEALDQAARFYGQAYPGVPFAELTMYRGEALTALGRLAEAEQQLRQSLAGRTKGFGEGRGRAESWQRLAALYLRQNQPRRATLVADSALAMARQVRSKELIHQTSGLLATAEAQLGHFDRAYAYSQLHLTYRDSIFDADKAREFARLQERFRSQQREAEITLLQRDTQLQTAENRQRTGQRNAALGGGLLLALVAGVTLNRYRLKQRTNQQLTYQNALLNQQKTEIEKRNAEKEVLLKEIHHRVKNNLQIILSLLNTQTESMGDGAALMAIRESQCRVQSMALIHQNLYLSDNLCEIQMDHYAGTLLTYLMQTLTPNARLTTQTDVTPLSVDVSVAVPLGLIINEAVTNALKYAYHDGQTGTICLSLLPLDAITYRLTVADNGVGLPAGFNWRQSRSLGLRLIDGLTDQINGRWHLETTAGVTLTVDFAPTLSLATHDNPPVSA